MIRTFFNMNPLSCECKDQLPRKESGVKLYGSRSRQLSHQLPSKRIGRKIMSPDLKKNPAENYMAPDPANFLHQLPQKESGLKFYGSRSRQLSASAPSKKNRLKIIWLQIPPTLFISSLKKNLAKKYGSRSRQLSHQLPKKESG